MCPENPFLLRSKWVRSVRFLKELGTEPASELPDRFNLASDFRVAIVFKVFLLERLKLFAARLRSVSSFSLLMDVGKPAMSL